MSHVRAVLFCCALGLLASLAGAAPDENLDGVRFELVDWQVQRLAALAKDAEAQGDASLARRCWLAARRAGGDADEVLSRLADVDDDPKLSDRKRAALRKRHDRYRGEAAKKLADLARSLEAAGRADEAAEVARRAIRHDPENAVARRVLGQERVRDWGWLPVEAAARTRKGQLELDGRWLPRKEVVRRRTTWKRAWEIESDHWSIRSDLKLDRVLELRDVLEAFRARWMADWEDLLPLKKAATKHRVLVFAREVDYVSQCQAEDSRFVQGVPGQYSTNLARSAFYDVEVLRAQGQRTSSLRELMLHECTHQLFRELVDGPPGNVDVGDTPNYWVHEGIAEYYGMHGFEKGRLALDRREIAKMLRLSYLKEHASIMPRLAELDSMPKSAFQAREQTQRRTHYAQSGFLCLFLSEGKHRGAFRRIVREVYCGKNEAGMLEARLDTDLRKLDAAFRRYVRSFPGR